MDKYKEIIKKGLASKNSMLVEFDLTESSINIEINQKKGKITLNHNSPENDSP